MDKFVGFLVVFLLIGCNDSKILIYDDYEKGIENAKNKNQKILLVFDFLGNPNISVKSLLYDKELKNELQDFTVILLNVDEPNNNGKLNKKLQEDTFGTSTQPMYYLLDSNSEILKPPIGYCDMSILKNFLQENE